MGTGLIPELLKSFTATACRLEQQPGYASDAATVNAWLQGDNRPWSETHPGATEWLNYLDDLAATGRTLTRIRLIDDPPTEWQRHSMTVAVEPIAAGEIIYYVQRSTVTPPTASDFWIFDSSTAVETSFVGDGPGTTKTANTKLDTLLTWWSTVVSESEPCQPTHLSPST